MVRPTDQKTGIEKVLCTLQFPRERDMPCHAGSHGEAPGSVKEQKDGEKKNMSRSLYCGFDGKEWARQGKQTYTWLV